VTIQDKMKADWDERAKTEKGAWSAILDRYEGSRELFYSSGKKHVEDMCDALAGVGIAVKTEWRLLEVGTGVGRCAMHWADLVTSVWATDVSDNMIDLALEYASRPNISYVCTPTLVGLPPFFDAVVSHLVYQHMPRVSFWKYLEEAWHILVPGGVFLTQIHITPTVADWPDDNTIMVRGYTIEELTEGIDTVKWDVLGIGLEAGISEVWKWIILKKK